MDVTTIAVPALILVVLSYVYQFAKPLLERLPGLRPSDATHNDGLRFVYGALAFALVLGFELWTLGPPATVVGWQDLLLSVLKTAVGIAVAGHYVYQKIKGGGTSAVPAATPTAEDIPPGAPSVEALGLPAA